MRSIHALYGLALSAVLTLSAATALPTAAGEPEEVMLKSGHAGMVEVVETTPDSVTLRGMKSGVEVTVKMRATDLDPHSFYEVRGRHMESTVENHVRLAVFAAENGLLSRARFQMDAAEALDPEVEQKIIDRPGLLEKIAQRVLEGARKIAAGGDPATALEMTARIIARAPDTHAAKEAAELAGRLDAEVAAKEEAEAADRVKKQEAAAAAATAEEAERMKKVLGPLEKSAGEVRKAISRGNATSGPSGSVSAFTAAAEAGEGLLKKIAAEIEAAADNADLAAALKTLDAAVRSDTVDAWLGAGNAEFGRDLLDAAEKYARRALAVDPDSARAASFLSSVEAASVMGEDFNRRFRRGGQRRPPGGGGRR